MSDRKVRLAWDGEWSDGYRARVLVVETDRGAELVLEMFAVDALGEPSWRPWPKGVPDLPCAIVEAVDQLAGLVKHCWIHSGYRDCGRDQMTSPQRLLFDAIRRREEELPVAQPLATCPRCELPLRVMPDTPSILGPDGKAVHVHRGCAAVEEELPF